MNSYVTKSIKRTTTVNAYVTSDARRAITAAGYVSGADQHLEMSGYVSVPAAYGRAA